MTRMALSLILMLLAPGAVVVAQDDASAANEEEAVETPAQEESPPLAVSFKTASYGLGLQMGRNFKFQEFEVDLDLMMQGLKDGLTGAQPRFGNEEMQAAVEAAQQAAAKAIGARNRALGEAYLAAKAKQQGVYTLPSGLQYEVLKEGKGPKPTAEDRVAVHYRSTLVDGTEIDNSFEGGEPQTHAVSGLIPAWAEALQLMPVGSRWRLFVPPELAHGDRGSGRIGPGATAIFEIELLGIADSEAASDPPAAREEGAASGEEGGTD